MLRKIKRVTVRIFLFTIMLIAFTTSTSFAVTSLLSTTGSIFIPTAKMLPDKGFNLGFFRLNVKDVNEIIKREYKEEKKLAEPKMFAYSFNYGLNDIIEIGIIRKEIDHNKDKESETLLVGKYSITKETKASPAISVGIIYNPKIIDAQEKKKDETSLFAVATHTLSYPRKIARKYRLIGTIGIGNKILDEVFGAVELCINPNVSVIAEYDAKNPNFGIKLKLSEGFIVQGFSIKENLGFLFCVEAK